MAKTFFVSDTHFGHANIIKFCNRPFKDIEEHDAGLIKNWNSVVGEKDLVYHTGDFLFHKKEQAAKILWSLNGEIILIAGNHDEKHLEKTWFNSRFKEIHALLERKVEGQRIIFCHFPIEAWNKCHYGSWHVHGHSHGTIPGFGKRLDIGVDCWGYTPVSFDALKEKMDKRKLTSRDYHQPRDKDGNIVVEKSMLLDFMKGREVGNE